MTLPVGSTTGREGGGVRDERAPSPQSLPRAFAIFMALHGIVHVFGFTIAWGLGGPRGIEHTTRLFAGSVAVGDTGVKLLGLVWLATAFAFLAVAGLLWRRSRWALPATVAVLAVSVALCAAGLPGAVLGLIISVGLLGLLTLARDRLILPPARAA